MRGRIAACVAVSVLLASGAVLAAPAPLTITRVGVAGRTVEDMTPDGRFLLLSGTDLDIERVERLTSATVASPFGDVLTADGSAVFGIQRATLPTPTRVELATGSMTPFALPPDWIAMRVDSIDDAGARLGVTASNGNVASVGVFVIDTTTGQATRLDSLVAARNANRVEMSADGSHAAFNQYDLVGCSRCMDVFVYSAATRSVTLASPDVSGQRSLTGNSSVRGISGDGRFVLFLSDEQQLVPGVTTRAPRYYLRDLFLRQTRLLPIPVSERPIDATLSDDGRRIAFPLDGTNVKGAGKAFVGVYDVTTGRTTHVGSTRRDGLPKGQLIAVEISADGRQVAFSLSPSAGGGWLSYVATL